MSSTCWTSALALLVATAAFPQDAPQLGTVTPSDAFASPGVAQTFTFTATYPDDGYHPELDMAITNDPNGNPNGCYFVWQETGSLSLYDDSTGNWYSLQLGTSGAVSNQHCQINGQGSSYYDSGGNVSLSLSVTFLPAWAGANLQFFGQAVDDNSNASSGWCQIPESGFLVLGPNLGPPSLGAVSPGMQGGQHYPGPAVVCVHRFRPQRVAGDRPDRCCDQPEPLCDQRMLSGVLPQPRHGVPLR